MHKLEDRMQKQQALSSHEFLRKCTAFSVLVLDSRSFLLHSLLIFLNSFGRSSLRYFDRLQPVALLVLRVVLGAIMIGHGYHKVFGGGFMEHWHRVQGLGLPGFLAVPSALAEFFGGILVLLGLFTRWSALAILIDM